MMADFPVDVMTSPQYDPSDPEEVMQAEAAMDLRSREQENLVRQVLSTHPGRAFVWMLMEEAGVDRGTFAGEMPMTMARSEGRREVGTWGKNWVFTVAPEMYIVMRREAVEREQRYADMVGLGAALDEE